MNKSRRLALATAVLVALAGLSQANAADIIPVITDPVGPQPGFPNGVGYNDTTPVAPVGGNPGTTRGEQRRIVANYAASLWGSVLQSNVPIYVQARFLPLAPNVLGSAGATFINNNFANAPFANTWYHTALADSIAGTNLVDTPFDITSQFSTNFTFYYGLDGNTPAGQTNFLDVVMHEYAHGLGFSNFENEATGTFFNGIPDIYSVYTYDNTAGKYWTAMTVAERIASAVNNGNVVFTGPRAVAGAQLLLDNRLYLRVSAPAGIAADYAYGTASFGPAAGPSNFAGQAVVATDGVGTPGDGCEAITSNVMGKIAIIDRGTCGFTIKVKNAQLAGATAVIIADNQPGAVAGMSGTDQTITIPSVRVTQASGNLFKSNVPVTVGMVEDPVLLQGADDLGRPRLFMPNPVQSGSSGSHYDSVATPNLLMEPAINSSLRSYYNLDMTPALMADIGWKLNTANAKIGSPRVPDCDTGIKAVTEGGLIAGGTVQANNDMCLLSAQTRWGYYSCMQAGRDRMLAVGLITSTQASKMMTCARRVADNTNFPLTSN